MNIASCDRFVCMHQRRGAPLHQGLVESEGLLFSDSISSYSKNISVVPIIGSAIGNSRLLGSFVTIGIGGFQSYSIGLII